MTTKVYRTAPYSEVEPMLNQLKNANFDEHEIVHACGYSGRGNLNGWRGQGKVPMAFKMALAGLVAQLGDKPKATCGHEYTFNEIELLFSALRAYRKAAPGRDEEIKKLLAIVASEMTRLA